MDLGLAFEAEGALALSPMEQRDGVSADYGTRVLPLLGLGSSLDAWLGAVAAKKLITRPDRMGS